jgi:hypothetical protein
MLTNSKAAAAAAADRAITTVAAVATNLRCQAVPFTPAHALAAIPFARGRFVFSALVIGSMVPDFSKIVTLSPATMIGHSWLGIFWFCVPVGFVLLGIFHNWLKQPLFSLLPESHQARLVPWLNAFSLRRADEFGWTALSLALGAFTHLVWDAFTHSYGLGPQLLPILNHPLFTLQGRTIHVYKILQHGSTIVGITSLVFLYFRWFGKAAVHPLPRAQFSERFKARVAISGIAIAGLISALIGFIRADGPFDVRWLKQFAGRSSVTAMAVICVQLLFFSIWFRLRLRPISSNVQ